MLPSCINKLFRHWEFKHTAERAIFATIARMLKIKIPLTFFDQFQHFLG